VAIKSFIYRFFNKIRDFLGLATLLADKPRLLFGPKKAIPSIFVDVSSLGYLDHGGGIQRVQKALISHWASNEMADLVITPIYFSRTEMTFKRFMGKQPSSSPNTRSETGEEILFCEDDVYLNLDLNYDFYIENQSLLRELNQRGLYTFTMVYDLLPILMPEMFPKTVSSLHTEWLAIATEQTTPICISRSVKKDLLEWSAGRLKDNQIEVVSLGGDFMSPTSTIATKLSDANNFDSKFLVVSTIEPRKSHEQVLRAFEVLWNEGKNFSLTFVGRQGWHTEELIDEIKSHPLNGKFLFWFPKLSDVELSQLYKNSSALINASIGEGFGLPLREALMHKLPLILRDIEVFREVAGEDAWFFTGTSPRDLSDSIMNWANASKSGKIRILQEASFPTWEDTCRQLIEIIQFRKLEDK
jgi:glycosyltransferase involved in cell wall biosynthesis